MGGANVGTAGPSDRLAHMHWAIGQKDQELARNAHAMAEKDRVIAHHEQVASQKDQKLARMREEIRLLQQKALRREPGTQGQIQRVSSRTDQPPADQRVPLPSMMDRLSVREGGAAEEEEEPSPRSRCLGLADDGQASYVEAEGMRYAAMMAHQPYWRGCEAASSSGAGGGGAVTSEANSRSGGEQVWGLGGRADGYGQQQPQPVDQSAEEADDASEEEASRRAGIDRSRYLGYDDDGDPR